MFSVAQRTWHMLDRPMKSVLYPYGYAAVATVISDTSMVWDSPLQALALLSFHRNGAGSHLTAAT